MPYSYTNSKGQKYILHGKVVTLQGGREQQIHYFAKEAKAGEALNDLPPGHIVVENQRTGLPFLKRDPGATAPAAGKSTAKAAAKPAAKATTTKASASKSSASSRAKK